MLTCVRTSSAEVLLKDGTWFLCPKKWMSASSNSRQFARGTWIEATVLPDCWPGGFVIKSERWVPVYVFIPILFCVCVCVVVIIPFHRTQKYCKIWWDGRKPHLHGLCYWDMRRQHTNTTQTSKNKIKANPNISTYMMMVFFGTLVSCSVTIKKTVWTPWG